MTDDQRDDDGEQVRGAAVDNVDSAVILSGPGGKPVTDEDPQSPRTPPWRLEDAASHDGTGRSEKR